MNPKDRAVIEKIKTWLEVQENEEIKEEIETSLNDIKYDVENFVNSIRFHTERFRREIGVDRISPTEVLEKSQFVSRGEFIKDLRTQIASIEQGWNLPGAFSVLGNDLFFLKEYELSVACFRRSLAYNPMIPEVYNGLGCCYFRQRRWIKAKRLFKQALELRPDYEDAALNLERAAEEHARQKKIDYWVGRGNRDFGRGALDEAARCYEKALEVGGRMPEVLVNLGNVYFRKDEDGKAEALYNEALLENAKYAPAYASLGKLRLRQERLKEAFENLQHAFVLDASLHDSLALMGDISFKWGNYSQALELYEAYLKLHPDSLTTLMLIGDCYLRMGKHEAARLAYQALADRGVQTSQLNARLRAVERG